MIYKKCLILVRLMMRCLIISLLALSGLATTGGQASPEPSDRHWIKGETHCFSSATADERRFEPRLVTRDGNRLFGDFTFNDTSEKTATPPTVAIRGTQLADGTFWLPATLEISDSRSGPWKSVGISSKVGTELTLTVPASMGAFGLKVDFAAFEPFLARGGSGRVTLPTGDSALIDLRLFA